MASAGGRHRARRRHRGGGLVVVGGGVLALALAAGALLRLGLSAVLDASSSSTSSAASGTGWWTPPRELSTPVSAHARLRECVALAGAAADGAPVAAAVAAAYAGDACHHPPLVVLAASALARPFVLAFGAAAAARALPLVHAALWAAADAAAALLLFDAARSWTQRLHARRSRLAAGRSEPVPWELSPGHIPARGVPLVVALAYFFSPYAVGSAVARSSTVFVNLCTAAALAAALRRRVAPAALALALAAYLALYPAVLVLPLSLLAAPDEPGAAAPRRWLRTLLRFGAATAAAVAAVLALSAAAGGGSWRFLGEVYGFILLVPDLSPNIGLFWYFFTEVFEHYRAFYLFFFQYQAVAYAVPLYVVLRRHPLFLFWVTLATIAAFKSYPELADVGLQLSLLPLFFGVVKDIKYHLVYGAALMFETVFMPVLWRMWIYMNTGNANFYYAMTLAWTLTQVLLIGDCLGSVLKFDYLERHPERLAEQQEQKQKGRLKDASHQDGDGGGASGAGAEGGGTGQE